MDSSGSEGSYGGSDSFTVDREGGMEELVDDVSGMEAVYPAGSVQRRPTMAKAADALHSASGKSALEMYVYFDCE